MSLAAGERPATDGWAGGEKNGNRLAMDGWERLTYNIESLGEGGVRANDLKTPSPSLSLKGEECFILVPYLLIVHSHFFL